MAGGGYLPTMTSTEWNNAPWNELEPPTFETCPECNGDCGIYYNEYDEELSKVDYDRLSDEDKSLWVLDKCCRCDGLGIIEAEPSDYQHYDDD